MTMSRITRRRVGVGAASLVSLFGGGCLGGRTGDELHEHEHDDPRWDWGNIYEQDGVETVVTDGNAVSWVRFLNV